YGPYAVGVHTVDVTDANGCPYQLEFTVDEHPVTPKYTASHTVCSGDSWTFSYDPDGQGSNDYGPYAVGVHTVDVTDANGCPYQLEFIVDEFPIPSCNAITELQCAGSPITVAENGGNAVSWKWTSNNPSVTFDNDEAQSTMANNTVAGDIIYVTITDGNGCESTCEVSPNLYNCTPNCETAFGVATQSVGGYDTVDESISSCFRNDGFSRWGWTNKISGFGEHVFSLYAGAAQCILGKGAYAGTVTLNYENDGTVTVSYNMASGYVLSEAHVYIGCDPYPKTKKGVYTVAPGQYSFNAGNLGYVQTDFSTPPVSASGDFYFIAHAVVCEKDIPEGCYLPGSPYEGGVFDYPTSPIETDCDVDTGGWGKVANSKDVTFTAYPVPFENEINISYKFDYETYVNIDVYDAKGSLVKQAVNNNYIKGTVDKTTLDLSRTDNQMYFVRLMTSRGMLVKKIISTSNLSRE
ncbi:T9SS type A sorting domain-containing protein, partial [Gaetbulibacter sp. M235]|uniref:T9SS type A sorting domain-containing protein n=1 Tax=Gaetbulibacter sp. M235 TaxID=3126510 RepID=UPI00374EB21D